MKKLVALLLTLTMVVGMTACGSKEKTQAPAAEETKEVVEETAETVEESPAEEVVISFAARQNASGEDAESAYLMKKIDEFNAMDNGITVELIWNPEETDYLNRLATDISANDCPNVFMEYGGSRVLDYLEAGLLVDLTPYYEEDADWYNSVNPTMWTPCVFDRYGFEGTYGIPWGAYQIVLVYNQAYLDQCSLEVPTTWAELMDCCKVLQENGIQPFNVGEKEPYRFGHLFSNLAVSSYGIETAEKIGAREIGYDSEEAKAIYTLIKDAYDAGYFGENILSFGASEERAYMGAGDSAFMWDLSSRIYWLEDSQELNAGNLHIAQMPAVNEEYYGYAQGGASQAFYVTSQATDAEIEASVEFLKYITSVEVVSGLMAETNSTYGINAESSSDIYIYAEVAEAMAGCQGLVPELQNLDTESGGMTIVRDALQTIVTEGASADEIAETILAGYEDLE